MTSYTAKKMKSRPAFTTPSFTKAKWLNFDHCFVKHELIAYFNNRVLDENYSTNKSNSNLAMNRLRSKDRETWNE